MPCLVSEGTLAPREARLAASADMAGLGIGRMGKPEKPIALTRSQQELQTSPLHQ